MALQSNLVTDSGKRPGLRDYDVAKTALAGAAAGIPSSQETSAFRNLANSIAAAANSGATAGSVSGGRKSSGSSSSKGSSSGGGYSGGGGSASVNPSANALSLLAQNYNNSVRAVNDKYNLDEQNLRNDAEKQLREAYINYMISRKNAANDMARLGYTGGVTESNLARMNNNYGTIRNDINRRLEDQLNPLRVNRNAELLSLLNNYNNQQLRYAL
jgi:hypothetical protein